MATSKPPPKSVYKKPPPPGMLNPRVTPPRTTSPNPQPTGRAGKGKPKGRK
jgi:hypothetical protein